MRHLFNPVEVISGVCQERFEIKRRTLYLIKKKWGIAKGQKGKRNMKDYVCSSNLHYGDMMAFVLNGS